MALSKPCFSFTIPSLLDDTAVDCRIYRPKDLHIGDRKRGAVVAHPYAPLGGSYDDPVVTAIAAELRKNGFVVGTFNFRGAAESKGSTTWTGKGEIADFVSFVGFLLLFLHHLKSQKEIESPTKPFCTAEDGTLTTIPSLGEVVSSSQTTAEGQIDLVIGGYSYGSLIATYLPPLEEIIQQLEQPSEGSAAAEIILRAERLASQCNQETRTASETRHGRGHNPRRVSGNSPHSVLVGGDEGEPGTRRASRDSRRSMDSIRRSLDFVRPGAAYRRSHSHSGDIMGEKTANSSLTATKILLGNTFYLLVSPLLPPVASLLTFFSDSSLWPLPGRSVPASVRRKLTANTSLAVWGAEDGFTSHKKLRKWAEKKQRESQGHFRFVEILGAGHFYHEPGVEDQLRGHIRDWSQYIRSTENI